MADWLVSGAASNPPFLRHRVVFHATDPSTVTAFDLHPTRNLVVTAHDNQKLRLWRYDLFTGTCCGSGLQNEFDFSHSSPLFEGREELLSPVSGTIRASKKGTTIRCVKFYDRDVLERKAQSEGVDTSLSEATKHKVSDGAWLIVTTDSACLFFNYWTEQIEELDGKAVTCVGMFADSPLVALGGSDGNVRIWDLEGWKKRATLSGGHSKGVVGLCAFGEGSHLRVVSAGEDGKVSYWKWTGWEVAENGMVKLAKGQSVKAHDRVETIEFDSVRRRCVTTGADRNIKAWDCERPGEEVYTVRPPGKTVWSCALPLNHPYFLDETVLVASKEDSKVVVTGASGQGLRDVVDAAELSGGSKKTRVVQLGVHAVHPSILLLTTRTEKSSDLFVIQLEAHSSPSFALSGQCRAKQQVHYMNESDKVFSLPLGDTSVPITPEKAFTLARKGGKAHLSVSPTQKYLAIISRNKHRYDIYQLDGYKKMFSGKAKSFAWLRDPTISPEDDTASLSKKGKKAVQEVFVTVEIEETSGDGEKKKKKKASGSPRAESKLYRHMIKGGKESKEEIQVRDGEAVHVWEGAAVLVGLWGVKAGKTKVSGAEAAAQENAYTRLPTRCRFLSIKEGCIGPELQVPRQVYWDSAGNFCLLAHDTRMDVCTTRPTFRLLHSLPFSCTSALFFERTLFFCTSEQVCLVNPMARVPHVVTLAHLGVPVSPSPSPSSLPLPRPPGPLSLVCVEDSETFNLSQLILLDVAYCVRSLSLQHPLVKFHVLAGAGLPNEAVAWADSLAPSSHALLAQVLQGLGHPQAAVRLPGLPLQQRMEICLQNDLLLEAVQSLRAMVKAAEEDEEEGWQNAVALGLRLVAADTSPSAEHREQALQLIARLDPSHYGDLLVHYAKTGKDEKMTALIASGDLPPREAVLAALLLGEDSLALLEPIPSTLPQRCILKGSAGTAADADAWGAHLRAAYPSLPAVTMLPPE